MLQENFSCSNFHQNAESKRKETNCYDYLAAIVTVTLKNVGKDKAEISSLNAERSRLKKLF
jgi:hypothetical protein